LKIEADGSVGGAFTGLSMSGRGRLFAHYSNGEMLPLADIHFDGTEAFFPGQETDLPKEPAPSPRKKRAA
jgi:hypothetical protein